MNHISQLLSFGINIVGNLLLREGIVKNRGKILFALARSCSVDLMRKLGINFFFFIIKATSNFILRLKNEMKIKSDPMIAFYPK